MRMVEQNDATFRRLKKITWKNRFWSELNIFSGNVIAWCVDSDEKTKKTRYEHFKSKKARKITSRGVSGLKISFPANSGIEKLSLALYQEMTNLALVSKIA